MPNKTFKKPIEFLRHPKEAFDRERGTKLIGAFRYMALLLIIVSAFSAAFYLESLSHEEVSLFLEEDFPIMYLLGLVFTIAAGFWLHLWSYVFGAKKGVHQTLKAFFYGGTPYYLLGWIPFMGLLSWAWSLYLDWLGLRRLHGMPGDRAAFSIMVAFVIPTLSLAVLAAIIYLI